MNEVDKKRRQFIGYSSLGLLGAVIAGGVIFAPDLSAEKMILRPPGALNEKDFLALCIKCGQCLQVCPYHSIHLFDITTLYAMGTPYINARERACYACEALPCVLACPSGALSHTIENSTEAHMGIAVLEYQNSCLGIAKENVPKSFIKKIKTEHSHANELELKVIEKLEAYEDKPCTICADMCPLENSSLAIEMVNHRNGGQMPNILRGCIGCGVCEELCPASNAAIVIKPRVTYEQYYIEGIKS